MTPLTQANPQQTHGSVDFAKYLEPRMLRSSKPTIATPAITAGHSNIKDEVALGDGYDIRTLHRFLLSYNAGRNAERRRKSMDADGVHYRLR